MINRWLVASIICFSSHAFASLCDGLPFYKAEAEARGYDMPLGCGLSVVYNHLDEEIAVDGINLLSKNSANQSQLNAFIGQAGLDIEELIIEVDTTILRFDVWLLPFLNVYALGGQTSGTADVSVNIANAALLDPTLASQYTFDVDFST